MHALTLLTLSLVLLAAPHPLPASPLPALFNAPIHIQRGTGGILSFLCHLKPLNNLLPCSKQVPSASALSTPLGPASGVPDKNQVARFVVKYASARRWQPSQVSLTWALPNNFTDPSALPLACPQPQTPLNSQPTDEDCLSMIIYVPVSAASAKIPALVWIHGGSFILGSATGPGLDGAALATATNSIVAVVQYRLGAFGFLSPGGQSNLAVGDMMTALKFLNTVLPSFNGDRSKITITGQSSGATMVRALLAAPSASGLFSKAILQSDPMNFGFLSPGAFQSINNFFMSTVPCSTTDSACLNGLSSDDILNLSLNTFGQAASIDASAGTFEPMRPVHDGSLIPNPMDLTAPFPRVSKPILLSTVKDEAGPAIFMSVDPEFVPQSEFASRVNDSLGEPRSSVIVNSQFYAMTPNEAANANTTDARNRLENLGTDQIWRCPNWSFARLWATHGGTAYVGEHSVGATYPDNAGVGFCTQGGTVCHEDDIQIVFGTAPNPSAAQRNAISTIQMRYRAFLTSGNPNSGGLAKWSPVAGNNVNAIGLSTGGAVDVTTGACDASFWGAGVPYDYQVFGT